MSRAKSAPGGNATTAREQRKSETNQRNGTQATLQMSHRSLAGSFNKQPTPDLWQPPFICTPFLDRVAHYFTFHLMLGGLAWFNRLTVLATATTDTSPFWGKLIPPTVIYFQQKWHTKKNMLTSYHSTSGSNLNLKKEVSENDMIFYSNFKLITSSHFP